MINDSVKNLAKIIYILYRVNLEHKVFLEEMVLMEVLGSLGKTVNQP
jgi:hypothetical protein